MSDNWKALLYNNLSEKKGKAPPIYSGMITKPNVHLQLSEIQREGPMIESTNSNMRGIKNGYKNKTYAHRSASFLPQD